VKNILSAVFLLWATCAWAQIDVTQEGVLPNTGRPVSQQLQAVLDHAPDGSTFYFPAGTYIVCNLRLTGRRNLTLHGEGAASILQYCDPPASYVFMLTMTDCTNMLLTHLAWDNRHIERFGGLRVYSSHGVQISDSTFSDSNPRPQPSPWDHWGVVFAHGAVPSTDIVVRDNTFTHLSLEVDHAQRVQIARNTIRLHHSTAAIGAFTITDGSIVTDYRIEDNIIDEPGDTGRGNGIVLYLDPATTNHGLFARITIRRNHLYRQTSHGYNIRFGTPDTSKVTVGNRFEDIVITDNVVHYLNGTVEYPAVLVGRNASLSLGRIVIERNTEVLH
jgi:polygalacturonase